MNKAILLGRLGNDPETFEGGARFSLATDDGYKKDGQKVERTNWHSVTVFGKAAEVITKYVKKGDALLVTGRIDYSKKDDKYYTNITLTEFEFVGGKSESKPEPKPQPQPAGLETGPSLPDDDDLPF